MAAVEVDPEEPLVLIGSINSWNVGSALQLHRLQPVAQSSAGGNSVESRVLVANNRRAIEFQIISATRHWNWRLHPAGNAAAADFGLLPRRATGKGVQAARAWLASGQRSETAHGRNFRINELHTDVIEVRVVISLEKGVSLWYSHTQDSPGAVMTPEPLAKASQPKRKAQASGQKIMALQNAAAAPAAVKHQPLKTGEFTQAMALKLQKDLLAGYTAQEVRDRLLQFARTYMWRMHQEEIMMEYEKILMPVHRKVMPKHGFVATKVGISEMEQLLKERFHGDPLIRANERKLLAAIFPWQFADDLPTEEHEEANMELEDHILPLHLIGGFCDWKIEVEALALTTKMCHPSKMLLDGWNSFTLVFELQSEEIEFQIVSKRLGFRWRIFPRNKDKNTLTMRQEFSGAVLGGESDGHGSNFSIKEAPGTFVHLQVLLRVQRFRSDIKLVYQRSMKLASTTVSIGKDTVQLINNETPGKFVEIATSHKDPKRCTFEQIGGLRLIGNFCHWSFRARGLNLRQINCEQGWREYSLCFRMLSEQVSFQIVSENLQFKWRVFPQNLLNSHVSRQQGTLRAVLGGENDGHGLNFVIKEKSLTVVTVRVKIQEVGQSLGSVAGQIYVFYNFDKKNLKTGIGENKVQYPLKLIHALSPEVLEACTTPEELQAALEKRKALIRRAVWELQNEYAADDVREEITGLRELYPHRSRKFQLAIEQGVEQNKQAAIQDGLVEMQVSPESANFASAGQATAYGPGATLPNSAHRVASVPGVKVDGSVTPSTASVASTPGTVDGSGDSISSSDINAVGDVGSSSVASLEVAAAADEGAMPEEEDVETVSNRAGLEYLQQQIQMYEGGGQGINANAKAAYLKHLHTQEKVLQKYVSTGQSADNNLRLFGDMDAQYLNALQYLPSVKEARKRAMETLELPPEMALQVITMGEEYHASDLAVFESNSLTLKRLRVFPQPDSRLPTKAAAALKDKGFYHITPQEMFFALDTDTFAEWLYPRRSAEACWSEGRFKGWFGGPRAGRFMVTSIDELFTNKTSSLLSTVLGLQDELRLIISAMGEEGKDLRVERRVLVSYHAQGEILPPWQDVAGMKSRRLTLTLHISNSHTKASDGGAMRLHQIRTEKERGGLVAEVPGGGGNGTVFYTHKFKQEVSRVKLPSGRWSIHVCAEDGTVADRLRSQGGRSNVSLAKANNEEPEDNFSERRECDRCLFAAGDGIKLTCRKNHHVCRDCIQAEIRSMPVPTCPVCAEEDDRVYVSADYDLFESSALDDLGCVCPEASVDPGARAILFGQCKSTGLNGKLCKVVWWEETARCWEVHVFATGKLVRTGPNMLQQVEYCPAGSDLRKCPCWPGGRGIYPVSLGCRCASKLAIDECTGPSGAPQGHPYLMGCEYQPFDSILTMLDAILFFLRHNFAHFFHFNNKVDVRPDSCPNVVFENWRSTMHSFPHHHPRTDAGKLYRRIERFRVLCRHAREVRGARPVLFIRYVWKDEEFARVDELYSLLRLWAGPQARLVLVAMDQLHDELKDKPELLRHARFPRVLFYLVGSVTIMNFMPLREAIKFSVMDEAGLLNCKSTTVPQLLKRIRPFYDPYTTDWLNELDGRDPAFFPDCKKAQEPGQGEKENVELLEATKKGNIYAVQALLNPQKKCETESGADANTWDKDGWTPLHRLCHLERCGMETSVAVKIACLLLLAHGDPQCHDKKQRTVLKAARLGQSSPELKALMHASAADEHVNSSALYRALEMTGEPARSQLARIFNLGGLRVLGEAETLWRNPPPGHDEIITEVEEEVRTLEALPEEQRKRAMKRLLMEWHPDKNPDRLDLATTVFQYLQTRKKDIIKR